METEVIYALCGMLEEACAVIRGQAEALAQLGAETDAGLAARRNDLLAKVEKEGWTA